MVQSKSSVVGHHMDLAKQNIAKFNAARDFGLKSLYKNDVSKQMTAMSSTMAQPFMQPLSSTMGDTRADMLSPIRVTGN